MAIILGKISIDLLFFIELMLLGFVLAELFELNFSIEKTVIYACGFVFAAGVVGVLFFSMVSQKGVIALASDYVAKNLQLTLLLYKNMGVSLFTEGKITLLFFSLLC